MRGHPVGSPSCSARRVPRCVWPAGSPSRRPLPRWHRTAPEIGCCSTSSSRRALLLAISGRDAAVRGDLGRGTARVRPHRRDPALAARRGVALLATGREFRWPTGLVATGGALVIVALVVLGLARNGRSPAGCSVVSMRPLRSYLAGLAAGLVGCALGIAMVAGLDGSMYTHVRARRGPDAQSPRPRRARDRRDPPSFTAAQRGPV